MTVTAEPTSCVLPDGRRLAWAEFGEPDPVHDSPLFTGTFADP